MDAEAPSVAADKCFLCFPTESLIVAKRHFSRIIAGLGPIVDNYCLVASNQHARSFADLHIGEPDAITEVARQRALLEQHLGPVLLTEHGRVPVCRDDFDHHDQHCHHAHMLLFPTAASIEQSAKTYYRASHWFEHMHDALAFAMSADNYLLISPNQQSFTVLSEPLNAPRQLARYLVSRAIGQARLADWRSQPNFDAAGQNARRLRSLFEPPR
jgi:hypothetical protein